VIHVVAGPIKPSGMVMTLSARYAIALVCCLFLRHGIVRGGSGAPTTLRFAVTVAAGLGPDRAFPGRLLVVLGPTDGGEPRLVIGKTGMNAAPILARDIANLAPGKALFQNKFSTLTYYFYCNSFCLFFSCEKGGNR